MDGRIGHWHCRYQVIGTADAACLVTPRLSQLAREQDAATWAEALDTALGDDPTVYVFRQVVARPLVIAGGQAVDARLAQRWGERLAGAVIAFAVLAAAVAAVPYLPLSRFTLPRM